ncbi:hypothetical protein HPB50_020118 [Hyalomma asiaticum]|uniref:Uncharacterized protein n=1 Tax=Hyalomma asiaticum TaxID=266040 RepID=A0ACB7S4F0_HYAAI|nr:hypothetical protein HPB50_020118 [Hyalomma asiaticum]
MGLEVSSVLNRDVSNFGKKHLTDGCRDTCWNSDQRDTPVEKMRIVFRSSTDMFGRVVVYHLAVCGNKWNPLD